MATNKNFEVKNGLSVGGTERISSAGAFTGSLASGVTATTQSAADNSTKIATTAYTDAAITAVIGGAPGTLDTLNELAAAINDDASYASTLTTALATKAPLASPTFTGTATMDVLTVGSATSQNSVFDTVFGSGDANEGIVIVPSTTGKGWVGFNNGNNANIPAQLTYNFSSSLMELYSSGSLNMQTGAASRLNIASNGDISFYEDTGTTPKLFWDASAECLSIGVIGTETDRRFQISATSPSTATTQYGIVANPTMSNDVTGSVYNIYSQPNVASGTTLTTLYNLYLGATGLSGSTITNNYGLYQAGASEKNYFAGNVGIANTAPSVELALGSGGGEKLHVYHGGVVKAGFGVDLSGSSRELSMFHSSQGTDGNISFGKRAESGGAYTEAMRITGNGEVKVPGTLYSPGHVIQTQHVINGSTITLSQTLGTYSTIVQVNITPKYATSKILITGIAAVEVNGGNYPALNCKIYRDGTEIEQYLLWGYEGPDTTHRILMEPIHFLDSPTTTSNLTYYVKITNTSGSTYTGTYNGRGNGYNASAITVQEIAQ